ncbi:MAG: hypothetical protein WA139_02330 [Candidatus Aenigmatarchaeota archaeon]
MNWKEFLKSNRKIAAILILLPLALSLLSLAQGILIADESAKTIIGTFILSFIPAIYIAASLLIKAKKVLTYYYVIFLPVTIIELALFFILGIIPVDNFLSMEQSLQMLVIYIIASTIVKSLLINPAFLVFLPRYIMEKKKNLYLSLFFPFIALTLVNIYPIAFLGRFMVALSSPDAVWFALTTFDIYSILDITVLTEILLVSALAYTFYRIFSNMLRNRKKK